ncbi:uncharacterized protein LOC120891702 [Ictidomys tridecemlineatus]
MDCFPWSSEESHREDKRPTHRNPMTCTTAPLVAILECCPWSPTGKATGRETLQLPRVPSEDARPTHPEHLACTTVLLVAVPERFPWSPPQGELQDEPREVKVNWRPAPSPFSPEDNQTLQGDELKQDFIY